MKESGRLDGLRLLVVEDDYFLADEMARALSARGAEVVGPVGGVDDALDLISSEVPLHGAVLDLNLGGEMAYPVADALLDRRVPLVFTTGYDAGSIPPRYRQVARCEKPVTTAAVLRALFG